METRTVPKVPKLALVIVVLALIAVPLTAVGEPPAIYDGFEQPIVDVAGVTGAPSIWLGAFSGEISGYSNGGGYADGVDSSRGLGHARTSSTPFTVWGDVGSLADGDAGEYFPPTGMSAKLDLYLDVAWAQANTGKHVDYTVALSKPDGTHQRDYIFNLQSTASGWDVSASNNVIPPAHGETPLHTVTTSGWYTLEHAFSDHDGDGDLNARLAIVDDQGTELSSWDVGGDPIVVGNPADDLGVIRYGWFARNQVTDLAFDETGAAWCTAADGSGCLIPP